MMEYYEEVILEAIQALDDKASKIAIHKFIYFLTVSDFPISFRFRPHTYGPFSADLSENLRQMDLLGIIKRKSDDCNKYRVAMPKDIERQTEISDHIRDKYHQFTEMVKDDFGFESLEVHGTVLYCIQALKAFGENFNKENVLTEFKAWKGSKYSDEKILEAYSRVKERFPH